MKCDTKLSARESLTSRHDVDRYETTSQLHLILKIPKRDTFEGRHQPLPLYFTTREYLGQIFSLKIYALKLAASKDAATSCYMSYYILYALHMYPTCSTVKKCTYKRHALYVECSHEILKFEELNKTF